MTWIGPQMDDENLRASDNCVGRLYVSSLRKIGSYEILRFA
jgi:hypothetical protein